MLETLLIYTLSLFLQANDLIQMCQVCKRLRALYFETMVKTKVWAIAELTDSVPREWVLNLKCIATNYCPLESFSRLQNLSVNWFLGDLTWVVFDNLPDSVLCITLGNFARAEFANWPRNLRKLEVGDFSLLITPLRRLPSSLTDATFGDYLHQSLEFLTMPSLTKLEFGKGFNECGKRLDLSRLKCPNLRTLKLNQEFEGNIPNQLKDKVTFVCYDTYDTVDELD
jgi:hypothetical protein